ncbi:alpha/beta hydrolase [Pigmentibacter ruber]
MIRPENSKKVLPAFVYFHVGGWVFGEFKGYERFIKDLVKNSEAVGIFVEYSLSPEAKFGIDIDIDIEEAYEVYAFETESYQKYSSGYLLTKELIQRFWNNY